MVPSLAALGEDTGSELAHLLHRGGRARSVVVSDTRAAHACPDQPWFYFVYSFQFAVYYLCPRKSLLTLLLNGRTKIYLLQR